MSIVNVIFVSRGMTGIRKWVIGEVNKRNGARTGVGVLLIIREE